MLITKTLTSGGIRCHNSAGIWHIIFFTLLLIRYDSMCESLNCVPVQIQCDAQGYHNMKSSSSDF